MKRAARLHPLLYAGYPILALLSVNLGQVRAADAVRPVVVSVVGAVVLLLAFRLLTGEWRQSAILVSGVLIIFFSYGHVYTILKTWRIGDFVVGRHRYLAPVALLLFVWWLWWGSRKRRAVAQLEAFFVVVGIAGLALPSISIARNWLTISGSTWEASLAGAESAYALEPRDAGAGPDIYYIIVDAYARADVLQDFYDYDNSEFLDFLTAQGFYVATESTSNYHMTDLSMASSLNLEYLDDLAVEMGRSPESRMPLAEMIDHSRVRAALARVGYRFVAFDTGVPYTSLEDADVFISPRLPSFLPRRLTEFEVMVLRTTAFRAVLDGYLQSQENPANPNAALAELHRQRVLLTLETLPEIPRWQGRYFVYAHVAIPHPPFVFGSEGEARTVEGDFSLLDGSDFAGSGEEYIDGYLAQLEWLSDRLREIIPRIIEDSETPPVIILQGDHGPRSHTVWENSEETNMREGMGILNAYYMPEGGAGLLYPTITPVNTFRVLFDEYFGANLELLDDDSYFLFEFDPFLFDKVTDRVHTD